MKDLVRARWWAFILATLAIVLLVAAASVVERRPQPRARSWPHAGPERARGEFIVSYGAASDADLAAWQERLRRDHVLERAAQRLNAFVGIPADVVLSFQQCGDDDAYYDRRRVTFCYEEVADYADLLAPAGSQDPLPDAVTREVEAAATFFVLHEAGHALVDVLNLPVTGKEEDAVDQFAVYFLTEGGPPDTREDAVEAAEVLGRLARVDSGRGRQLPLWDVHSLDAQRQANLLCWLYGGEPRAFAPVVRRAGLPQERQSSCEEEYAQLAESWSTLLGQNLKDHSTPDLAPEPQSRAWR